MSSTPITEDTPSSPMRSMGFPVIMPPSAASTIEGAPVAIEQVMEIDADTTTGKANQAASTRAASSPEQAQLNLTAAGAHDTASACRPALSTTAAETGNADQATSHKTKDGGKDKKEKSKLKLFTVLRRPGLKRSGSTLVQPSDAHSSYAEMAQNQARQRAAAATVGLTPLTTSAAGESGSSADANAAAGDAAVDVPRARKPLTARNSIDIARMRAAKMLRLTTTKSALNRSATSDSRQSSASALSTTSSQMTTVFSRPGQQSPLLKPIDDTAGLHASELGGSAFKEEFQLEPPALHLAPASAAATGTSIEAAPAEGDFMTRRPSVRFEEHLKRRSGSTATQHPVVVGADLSKQMHELELGEDAGTNEDRDAGGTHTVDIVESKEAPAALLKIDTASPAAAAKGKQPEHAQLSAKSMQEYEDEVLALQL